MELNKMTIETMNCTIENFDRDLMDLYTDAVKMAKFYLILYPFYDTDDLFLHLCVRKTEYPYSHGDLVATLYHIDDCIPETTFTINIWK